MYTVEKMGSTVSHDEEAEWRNWILMAPGFFSNPAGFDLAR